TLPLVDSKVHADDVVTVNQLQEKDWAILRNMKCDHNSCVFNNARGNIICHKHVNLYKLFDIYEDVRNHAVPNFKGAKRGLLHKFNMEGWRNYSHVIEDDDVLLFLNYGFPVDYRGHCIPVSSPKNHSSAIWHPEAIERYIQTEIDEGALYGPFEVPPFDWVTISPLMTRDKKGSDKKRVILDLSFPEGASVNSGVDKKTYLNVDFKLQLPSALTLKELIANEGEVYMWSLDIRRAYRQLRSDPLDMPLLCFQWNGKTYVDSAVPFGLRHGARNMQAVSKAFTNILAAEEITSLAYIDDVIGIASTKEKADKDLGRAVELLKELGVEEATDKRNTATKDIIWLGIQFNSKDMIMRIPDEKIKEC
ncbi:MAG: hypothetical protein GY774_08055, partial [Planctomycetes bacterium]|nr:hypothetical protein [Planctomycetota bacterium]